MYWVPCVLLGTWSAPAFAQDEPHDSGMLSAGYIHSFVWGHSPAAGNGLEVSYEYYESRYEHLGVGAFLQLQDYSGTRREALGLQANASFLGAEVGWAHRGADDTHASTHGLHLGLFASAGFALIGFRVVPPLSTVEPNHGTELSLTLGLKFFFALHGQMLEFFSVPHGRPLRLGGVVRSLRHPLSNDWEDAALAEHESVASFAALALDLLRLGAPRALIRDCHVAAREELAHVEFCKDQASLAARASTASLAALLADHSANSLEQVLVGCFLDGCLGEGFAALEAELAAQHPQAAEIQSGLLRLAAEENSHAALAWRVLDWGRRSSPRTHAEALKKALFQLSTQAAPASDAYACLPAEVVSLAFEVTRCAAIERALAMQREPCSGLGVS